MKLNNDSRRKFLKDTALVTAAASMPSLFTQARTNRKVGEKVKIDLQQAAILFRQQENMATY